MTSVECQDGQTETVYARRTESIDASGIHKLSRPDTVILFGRKNVVNIIEKAVFAVTLHNDENEILGHGAFYDYPNTSIDQAKWEQWFIQFYHPFEDGSLTPLNTLFLHYFVTTTEYSVSCGREIIRTVFNAVPDLQYIIMTVPVGSFPDQALSEFFHPIKRVSKETHKDNLGTWFVCHRHTHIPELYVRNAKVEDHDDLTPIFNRQSDMLHKTYGNYFLAELIEAQDEHMQCLVAEEKGTAIGFMSLSDDVNFDLLNQCFELAPFHGLCCEDDDDVLENSSKDYVPVSHPEGPLPLIHIKSDGVIAGEALDSSAKSPKLRESLKDNEPGPISPYLNGDDTSGWDGVAISSKLSTSHINNHEDMLGEKCTIASPTDSERFDEMSTTLETLTYKTGTTLDPTVSYSIMKVPMPQLSMLYRSHPPARFIPKYTGKGNAFAMQLFCIEDQFETRSCDFVKKAFALFPDKEYCIITVPHLVPVFPLLQAFTRVTPRCPNTLSQELYIFHRFGLRKDIAVRLACTSDNEGVRKLIKTLNLSAAIMQHLDIYNKCRRDESGVELQAVVAECGSKIIGICVLQHEHEIEYIRSHYNIEDFIYYNHHLRTEHAHVFHFVLSPAFNHYTQHFLKEIMRITHKTSLYYPVYPNYLKSDSKDMHSMVTCLNEMVPVHPRRQIYYPIEELGINAPSKRILLNKEAYALNHINRKLSMEPKVTVNARIVVVGASDVAMAFLQTLAYCPHLRFNNLTLISPHGLPGEMEPEVLQDGMLMKTHCYNRESYAKMGLRIWVNSVFGKMTAIDRARKLVVVNENTQVPYDHLILCTGKQYQVPAPSNNVSVGPVSEADLTECHTIYMGSKPDNLFLINDEFDAAVVLYWIETNVLRHRETVVIYGDTLDVYCTIHTLLQLGVLGSNIVLVRPAFKKHTTCFNNPVVDDAVNAAIKKEGVTIHDNFIFSYWSGNSPDSLKITSVTFVSTTANAIHIDCGVFLSFATYSIDDDAFKAMNDACLVFDGQLVIDAAFHTNDVSIRAAGPLTKFKRRYHVGDWTHAIFNSKEVGIALASAMLRLFDPTLEPITEPPKELLNLIPIYRNAKIQGGVLPGGYQYLHVQKPNLPQSLSRMKEEFNYGRDIETDSHGYFRLYFNQYKSVEIITCLLRQPYSVGNLTCLYGMHERFLNNIFVRHHDGLVPDLFSFFTEPWSLALFHDRFDDFCDEVRELLMSKPSDDVETIEDKLRQIIDDEVPLTEGQIEALKTQYQKTATKHAVEMRLLNFLGYNHYHLPMYAKPGMV